jgi:hypothetical protein
MLHRITSNYNFDPHPLYCRMLMMFSISIFTGILIFILLLVLFLASNDINHLPVPLFEGLKWLCVSNGMRTHAIN